MVDIVNVWSELNKREGLERKREKGCWGLLYTISVTGRRAWSVRIEIQKQAGIKRENKIEYKTTSYTLQHFYQ